jgi:hypothetical protein
LSPSGGNTKKFPVDRTIANVDAKYRYAYSDPAIFTSESHSGDGFKVDMNITFHFFDGFETRDVNNALRHSRDYMQKRQWMSTSERFREENGTSLVLPSQAQADYLSVCPHQVCR